MNGAGNVDVVGGRREGNDAGGHHVDEDEWNGCNADVRKSPRATCENLVGAKDCGGETHERVGQCKGNLMSLASNFHIHIICI